MYAMAAVGPTGFARHRGWMTSRSGTTLPYSRTGLDRVGGVRDHPAAVRDLTGRPDRVTVAVHGDRVLLRPDPGAARRAASAGPEYLLGLADGVPHVALDLSGLDEAAALAAVG